MLKKKRQHMRTYEIPENLKMADIFQKELLQKLKM